MGPIPPPLSEESDRFLSVRQPKRRSYGLCPSRSTATHLHSEASAAPAFRPGAPLRSRGDHLVKSFATRGSRSTGTRFRPSGWHLLTASDLFLLMLFLGSTP